eukprot:scaffold675097_cov57-Prasinocladus_malaysianus.AAC.1
MSYLFYPTETVPTIKAGDLQSFIMIIKDQYNNTVPGISSSVSLKFQRQSSTEFLEATSNERDGAYFIDTNLLTRADTYDLTPFYTGSVTNILEARWWSNAIGDFTYGAAQLQVVPSDPYAAASL